MSKLSVGCSRKTQLIANSQRPIGRRNSPIAGCAISWTPVLQAGKRFRGETQAAAPACDHQRGLGQRKASFSHGPYDYIAARIVSQLRWLRRGFARSSMESHTLRFA